MAATQAAADRARPWWKDGEYDEERAESANDRDGGFRGEALDRGVDEYTGYPTRPRRAG